MSLLVSLLPSGPEAQLYKMSKIVHVIDVESGNLQSLRNAIEHLGYTVELIRSPDALIAANPERLILPGVGNYGHFVNELFSRGFEQPIKDYVNSGKPIMVFVLVSRLYSAVHPNPH